MASFSNYGHSMSTGRKILNGARTAGAAAAPYFATPLQNTENPMYEAMYKAKKVASIATFIAGDFYSANALQSYNNMNFNGGSGANDDYLKNLGLSNTPSQYTFTKTTGGVSSNVSMSASDFSASDFSALRANGKVTVNGDTYSVKDKNVFNQQVQNDYKNQTSLNNISGASSKKEKLNAMGNIYNTGLNHMKQSNNLVSISDAARKGGDAVRSECNRVQSKLEHEIRSLANQSNSRDLINRTLSKGQLTDADLNAFNRAINSDKSLTSAQKAQLKQAVADRNEIKNFIGSGAINGGNINKMKGKMNYGKRMLVSSVVGHDMQRGIDTVRVAVKLTKFSAKTTFALGRACGNGAGALANTLAKPGAKLVDMTTSKITGIKKDNTSNFLKHAQEKRRKNIKDRKEWNRAKKNGTLKELKKLRKEENLNNLENKLDNKIRRNQSRLSDARRKGNTNAINRYNRKNNKLKRKKDSALRKRERRNRKEKFMANINNKTSKVTGKFTKIANAFKAPINALRAVADLIKRVLFKYIAIPIFILLLGPPMSMGLGLTLTGFLLAAITGDIHFEEQKAIASIGYPASVEQWREDVVKRCEYHKDDWKDGDITLYVNWILAMIWQESGGAADTPSYSKKIIGDIMQCEESGYWTSGTPDDWDSLSNQQKSIDAGIRVLIDSMKLWKPEGPGDIEKMKLACAGYNFGLDGWHTYCVNHNITEWSLVDATIYKGVSGGGTPSYGGDVADKYLSGGEGGGMGSGEVVKIAGAEGVIKTATNQIGIKENPAYTNNVVFNTWYYGNEVSETQGSDGKWSCTYPWCCAFVTWVFHQSGNAEAIGNVHTAGCQFLQGEAQRGVGGMKGFTDIKKVEPGDIVIFRNGEHVGIIVSKNNDGTLTTIEGNTSGVGFDSDGGCVAKKQQEAGTYYIRPNWNAAKKKMKKENKESSVTDIKNSKLEVKD